MELSDRKKKILKAVVCENIKSAEPVSSQDLKDRYIKDVSSATIRNELMALEEMGFLSQPHSSSGRLPTAQAFRLYADELAGRIKPTEKEIEKLRASFDNKMVDMEDFARSTARIISDATHYATVVKMNFGDDAVIDKINVIKISKSRALVVVVTDIGVIKDIIINTESDKDDRFFEDASKFITTVYQGKCLADLKNEDILMDRVDKFKQLFNMVLEVISSKNRDSDEFFAVEGTSNLLNYPEYTSVEKARDTIKLFENKKELYPLIKTADSLEINVKVGGEDNDKLSDCSLVSATYKINGKEVGGAYVIGPVRMDYERTIKVLKGVSESLNDCFNKGGNDEQDK